MASADPATLAACLTRLAVPPTDADLLARYAAGRDEAAFAELVRRHGPAVLAACRRITTRTHDAEDAFQATFLVLARKFDRVRPGEPLGAWLYGVAVRVARKAAGRAYRRWEVTVGDVPDVPERAADPFDPDAARVVAEEVGRLSPWHRAAVVLCELEGRSRSAAARELGIAEGTLSSRLAAARKRLARRLSARGFGPAALATLVGVTAPPGLVRSAVEHASRDSSPAAVAALTHGVARAMFLHKLRAVPVAFGLFAALALAAGPGESPRPRPAPVPVRVAADPPAAKAKAAPPAGPGTIVV
ncbi:MAG TPA: sigma-70 family RNA polymerase sigma factor, partial [Urbifossiella sp.]|nr:sigma-70 family RNA polymerase sigma factor [Urbifossiella sp.]